jgi:hypothetical protein
LLLFPAAPAWGATVVTGTDRNALDNATSAPGDNRTIEFTSPGITFTNNSATIIPADTNPAAAARIERSGTTIQGGASNNYITKFGNLAAALFSGAEARKTQGAANIANWVQSAIAPLSVTPSNLTYIQGSASPANRGVQGTLYENDGGINNRYKWLRFKSAGSGLSLRDMHFRNVDVRYRYAAGGAGGIVNGLIGNDHDNAANISMGTLAGNAFTNIDVSLVGTMAVHYLAGGGIIGLRSTAQSAYVDTIIGNLFKDLTVTTTGATLTGPSAYLEGGGIIGVDAVSSPADKPGHAEINYLVNNLFTGVKVISDDVLLGGGLVGLNNNSKDSTGGSDTYVRLFDASGNIFGDGTDASIKVDIGYSLRGGGVIGLNGLSTAPVDLDFLTGNIFAGIDVTAGSYLRGGGIVGLQTNDGGTGKPDPDPNPPGVKAYLGNVSDNLFVNLNVSSGAVNTTGATGNLEGGGIIGVRSNKGLAAIGSLTDNLFTGLTVNVNEINLTGDYHLDGGGIVGVSSLGQADMQTVSGNYFDASKLVVKGALRGGGILGASSDTVSVLNSVAGNTLNNLKVEVSGSLYGGGMVGVNTNSAASATSGTIIEYLTGNIFSGLSTAVEGDLAGGGIAGGYTGAAGGGIGSVSISGNRFATPYVYARSLSGGGILGFNAVGNTSTADAYITSVADNDFIKPVVETDRYISGGGVLGVRSEYGISYIKSIAGNLFQEAEITAGTYIDGGGLIGATGEITTISSPDQIIGIGEIVGSVFSGNKVTAKNGQIMGGAVYSYGLDTGMTISDSLFTDNTFSSKISDSSAYNGGVPSARVYGTVTVDTGRASADNTLTLTAGSGKSTIFRNNKIIEGSDERYNSLYFGIVDGFSTDPSSGNITTTPDPAVSDARLIVEPQAGGVVALYDPIRVNQNNDSVDDRGFAMTVRGAGEFLWGGENLFEEVNHLASGALPNTVRFEPGSTTTLLSGMSLDAESHDVNLLSGGRINVMGGNRLNVNRAVFNGHMHFNLMGTTLNTPSTVLLTINNPTDSHVANADIAGATVSLSDFAAGPTLRDGDEFYLIATDEYNPASGDGYLKNDPATNRAKARQGLTREYDFIVDKNQTKAKGQNRYLVARLASSRAAPQTRILSEGRAAGLAFLAHTAGWLADHSFQQADLALKHDGLVSFGGIDGSVFRVNTGSDLTIKGTHFLAGLAARNSGPAGASLLGGFFEAGFADYDIDGDFTPSGAPDISGGGTARFYGAGLLARQTWRDLRLEGSLRAGRLENHFDAGNYKAATGESASFDSASAYFAAHAGLGYEWRLSDSSTLDFLARYYWTRQNGGTVDLPTEEKVRFKAAESHRARGGIRYTHAANERVSFYGGAAYEYEFDGKTRASAHGFNFDSPDMGGATGIGEIGAIVRSRAEPRLSAEVGLQSYVGAIRGVSAGIRLGWEF